MGRRWRPPPVQRRLMALAWGSAGLALLIWASSVFVAERTVPTLLLTYFFLPQFWLLPVLLILLVSVWRRSGWAVVGSGAALVLNLSLLGWQTGWQTSSAQPAATFRLMTYNIARGGAAAPKALAATVLSQDPDVVCLQEVNGVRPAMFAELLGQLPGYAAVRSREVAILFFPGFRCWPSRIWPCRTPPAGC